MATAADEVTPEVAFVNGLDGNDWELPKTTFNKCLSTVVSNGVTVLKYFELYGLGHLRWNLIDKSQKYWLIDLVGIYQNLSDYSLFKLFCPNYF